MLFQDKLLVSNACEFLGLDRSKYEPSDEALESKKKSEPSDEPPSKKSKHEHS